MCNIQALAAALDSIDLTKLRQSLPSAKPTAGTTVHKTHIKSLKPAWNNSGYMHTSDLKYWKD